jgi:transposase
MFADDHRPCVYPGATPTDMRRSFDTLAALVTQAMGRDPLSGDLSLLVNQACRVAKVPLWDGS